MLALYDWAGEEAAVPAAVIGGVGTVHGITRVGRPVEAPVCATAKAA